MQRHRFNPLSALVGLAIVALGAAVAVFGFDELDDDPIIWGAAIAVFVAMILVAIPTRARALESSERAAPSGRFR